MPIFFSNDGNLKELKKLIKKYYLMYDYYVLDTTIEGLLINEKNIGTFDIFLKEVEKISTKKLEAINFLTLKSYNQEKLNIYRILCEGKCDLLMGISELKKSNPIKSQDTEKIYSLLEEGIESKTNGWVSRWIEYFVCKEIDVEPFQENSYNKVKHILDINSENPISDVFANSFQELNDWIFEINKRYKKV